MIRHDYINRILNDTIGCFTTLLDKDSFQPHSTTCRNSHIAFHHHHFSHNPHLHASHIPPLTPLFTPPPLTAPNHPPPHHTHSLSFSLLLNSHSVVPPPSRATAATDTPSALNHSAIQ
nr:hypothetical transcript [Hymenolepis microstoma]